MDDDEREIYELERAFRDQDRSKTVAKQGKDGVRKAKEQAEETLASMHETVAAAIYSGLIHEDPAVRLKAAALWLNKFIATPAAKKDIEDEAVVVEAGPRFEDLLAMIEELKEQLDIAESKLRDQDGEEGDA